MVALLRPRQRTRPQRRQRPRRRRADPRRQRASAARLARPREPRRERRPRAARRGDHPRVPPPRAPLGRPRPARPRVEAAARARARELRTAPLGPRPRRAHGRPRGAGAVRGARRHPPPRRDLLPLHRRRVRAHRRPRAARVAPAAHGGVVEPPRALGRRAAPPPRAAHRRRDLRAVSPHELPRQEALLARRRRVAHSPHGPHDRPRGRPRRRGGRHRHGPPRAPERPLQHHGQVAQGHLRALSRRAPRALEGPRRREVSPRILQRSRLAGRAEDAPLAGVQPRATSSS